ncbi:MAG: hypothetical protein ABI551_13405 [Polyangiaceae bacterium]
MKRLALASVGLGFAFFALGCSKPSGGASVTVETQTPSGLSSHTLSVGNGGVPPSASAEKEGVGAAVNASGAAATCATGKTCAFDCPAGKCVQTCGAGSTCAASCAGGACLQTCAGGDCDMSCAGGKCAQVCADAACRKSCSGGGCT